jgi:hypothetical protein
MGGQRFPSVAMPQPTMNNAILKKVKDAELAAGTIQEQSPSK